MKIHFIAIGGIGMSALARYYLACGFKVSGSNLEENELTQDLRKLGAEIYIGHSRKNFLSAAKEKIGLVVRNAAVAENNPELKEAKKRKIKCQKYAQAVGGLTKKYFTIAISGTHGKSTTTAMAALLLVEAGFDPTVIVGTKLMEFGNSNFRIGKAPSEKGTSYLVVEADEFDSSFLNYSPDIIILTNIDSDHLDYFKNFETILKTFIKYVGQLPPDGILIANSDDPGIEKLKKLIKKPKFKISEYSLNQKEAARIREMLKVPGNHNVSNALAVLALARSLEIKDGMAWRALGKFHGTWRRFEYRGRLNGASIFDDYGHHPTEIKATLQGAREVIKDGDKRIEAGGKRLWCVFQPHQYQRTYELFDKFSEAFDEADVAIILPIYSVAGREKISVKKKVNSERLVEAIKTRKENLSGQSANKEVIYLDSFEKTADYLREYLREGDLVVIMGAGDVNLLTNRLV